MDKGRRSLRSSDGGLIAGCEVWTSAICFSKACDVDRRRSNLVFAATDVVKGKPAPGRLRFAARCNHCDVTQII